MSVKLALYKGNGNILNKAIRVFNKVHFMGEYKNYSHCELVVNNLWYTSSYMDGGVRVRHINGNSGNWDFIEIPSTAEQEDILMKLFTVQKNKKYDVMGVFLSQLIPLEIENPKKWFCSEICAYLITASGLMCLPDAPQKYSPATLAREINKIKRLFGNG